MSDRRRPHPNPEPPPMTLSEAASYRLLGLPEASPLEEVRRAYRALARRLHPDLSQGTEEQFKQITAAYNLLIARLTGKAPPPKPAPAQRERPAPKPDVDYDSAWSAFRAKAGDRARAWVPPEVTPQPKRPEVKPAAESPRSARATEKPLDAQETFSGTDADERPGLGARFAAFARSMVDRALPRDVTLRLKVEAVALVDGGALRVGVPRERRCTACRGNDASCACGGTGRVSEREILKVHVPADSRPGAKLRLGGKGRPGFDGEPAGDLYLLLDLAPTPGFTREGDDLIGALSVPRSLALSGGELSVKLPVGTARVRVPKDSRTGDRLRLPSQGLPGLRGRGDVYLVVEVA